MAFVCTSKSYNDYIIDTTDKELIRMVTEAEIGGVVQKCTSKRFTSKPTSRLSSPRRVSPRQETVKESSEFEFFWKKLSPFSQFHSAQFVVDGLTFQCAEQFMMHQKAMVFGSHDIASKILQTTDPVRHKALGRSVKNYDDNVWNDHCVDVVKRGNKAKFSQNAHLKEALFATYPKILVEASPQDTKWGIGLTADHPDAQSRNTWRGENLLGFVLTDVRDELMNEEGLL